MIAPPDQLFVDLIAAACRDADAPAHGWPEQPHVEDGQLWIRLQHPNAAPRGQGWKLHVSASLWSAADVLERALPVLLREDATFKVAATPRVLAQLNRGDGGLSQIAKFITVYPNDDEQAVRLALALDQATRGLRGPRIPSDRQLAPGSLVHYRYGGFSGRVMQLPAGELVPAILTPDGALQPDPRLPVYRPPAWATDPFAAAGLAVASSDSAPNPGEGYRLISVLHRSPRGEVYLGIDLVRARRCVLKRARAEASIDDHARDARDRLRHEAQVLARLAGAPAVPEVYDLVDPGGDADVWLAMEDVAGTGLDAQLALAYGAGQPIPGQQVVAWGRQLATVLGRMHAAGLTYRDLKPSNLILAPDGRLRLIDFEMVHDAADPRPVFGLGTPGYMSPQQRAGHPPRPADDIYALGAVLYFAATGADPSQAPLGRSLLDRPLRLLNPAIGPGLAAAIGRCLEAGPERRYPSMQALDTALAELDSSASSAISIAPPPLGQMPAPPPEPAAREAARRVAQRLGDTICATAQEVPGTDGLTWVNTHRAGLPIAYRTIDIGAAGIVLGLAGLVAELGDGRHRAVLDRAADWLLAAPPPEGPPVAGLYVGEAGIGAALLRAGQVLDRPSLIGAAAQCGRSIARLPLVSPDLYNGAAGRLRFHVLLWDATGEPDHLAAAVRIGDWLLENAESVPNGGLCWRFPEGFSSFAGKAFVGYAHGAAGIADTLLDLYAATGAARFAEAAQAAGRWLLQLAVPTLSDGAGLDWPAYAGGTGRGGLWCHGATGIGRFFLHAAQQRLLPEASEVADRSARMVARGTRWASPVQCHGLAGAIEFLLDMYQATAEPAYLAEARAHARALDAFATERDGQLLFPSDSPFEWTPSFMLGYAGVAACWLRLSAPERLPHQLSRAGFRQPLRSL